MRSLLLALSKIMRSSTARPTSTLRTKPGKNACGFANSGKLSVKVCKTWTESQRTHYGKITQSKSGQAPTQMTERQNWIQDTFNFLKTHIRPEGLSNLQLSSPWPKEPVHLLPQHTTSPEVQLTWIVWRSTCDHTPQYSLQLQASFPVFNSHPQVKDQFAQMETMLSSFLWPRQKTIRTAFCN